MSDPKTKPTDADVGAFLDAAQPARRVAEGHRLDALMREGTDEEPVLWGPSIVGYGSYRYVSPSDARRQGDRPTVGFSPRKGALTIYGIKDLPQGAALLPQLGDYAEGAGCVYVKRLEQIDVDVLRRLVAIAATREDDPQAG